MFLGREQKKRGLLDEATMETKAARDARRPVGAHPASRCARRCASLSGGQRQTVAIARAVLWNSKVVILDEPTAALGVAQTEQVLALVRRLADRGLGVVLISHNLNDVFQVADDIAVLYLGQMVAQVDAKDVTNNQVVELITDRPPGPAAKRPRRRRTPDRRRTAGMSTTTEPSRQPQPGLASRARRADDRRGRPRLRRQRSAAATSARCRPSLGLIVLVIVFAVLRPDTFTERVQLRQPDQPGAGGHRHRDGPGLRAAARRDRPVGRLHRPDVGGGASASS